MRVSMIVAADEGDVIGAGGKLPWHLPEDMKRFRQLTTGHVLVAGRATHDSIVDRLGHPLPGRITVVASRTGSGAASGMIFQPSVESALAAARTIEDFAGGDEVFVVGGAQIYAASMSDVDRIYLTRVHRSIAGDTVMPAGWLTGFGVVEEEPRDGFTFLTLERAAS